MISPWRRIKRWWAAQAVKPVRTRYVKARPTACEPHRLYVTGSPARPEHGFMVCPCGCGAMLTLRFAGERSPRWTLERDWHGRVSLTPSVWRSSGCESHFVLKRGVIRWC